MIVLIFDSLAVWLMALVCDLIAGMPCAGAVPGAGRPADAHQVHEDGEQGAAAAPGR